MATLKKLASDNTMDDISAVMKQVVLLSQRSSLVSYSGTMRLTFKIKYYCWQASFGLQAPSYWPVVEKTVIRLCWVIYVKGWWGQIVTHEGLALLKEMCEKKIRFRLVSDKTVQRIIRMCHTANRAMLRLHNKNERRAIPGQPIETFFMICY